MFVRFSGCPCGTKAIPENIVVVVLIVVVVVTFVVLAVFELIELEFIDCALKIPKNNTINNIEASILCSKFLILDTPKPVLSSLERYIKVFINSKRYI